MYFLIRFIILVCGISRQDQQASQKKYDSVLPLKLILRMTLLIAIDLNRS